MGLSDVHHQTRAIDALKAALKSGNLHHTYLFGGPDGVGKELTAIGFAQALCCETDPQQGCGGCSGCVRVAKRNHPDVLWVMPEDEQVSRKLAGRADFAGTPSRDIKVEQIRSLQERLALRSLEGGRKIAFVCSAHMLNPQAQNAFLKTLEEPPPNTVIILIASSPDKLLPTIRSRCSKVSFGALPAEFIAQKVMALRELPEQTARLVGVMASGSLSLALQMDIEGLERRKEVIERYEAIGHGDARPVMRFAEEFGASREEAEAALKILDLWNRDLALLKAGSGALANQDLLALAEQTAHKLSMAAIHRRHELMDETQVALTRNGSPRMQLERMLLLGGGHS